MKRILPVILVIVIVSAAGLAAGLIIRERNSLRAEKESLVTRIAALETELKQAQSASAQAQTRADELETQKAAAEKSLLDLAAASAQTETQLRETIAARDESVQELDKQLSRQADQIETLHAEALDLTAQFEAAQAAEGEARRAHDALKLESESQETEITALKTGQVSLEGSLSLKDGTIRQLNLDQLAQQEANAREQAQISSLEQAAQKNAAKLAAAQTQADAWAVVIEQLRVELADAAQKLGEAQAASRAE